MLTNLKTQNKQQHNTICKTCRKKQKKKSRIFFYENSKRKNIYLDLTKKEKCIEYDFLFLSVFVCNNNYIIVKKLF